MPRMWRARWADASATVRARAPAPAARVILEGRPAEAAVPPAGKEAVAAPPFAGIHMLATMPARAAVGRPALKLCLAEHAAAVDIKGAAALTAIAEAGQGLPCERGRLLGLLEQTGASDQLLTQVHKAGSHDAEHHDLLPRTQVPLGVLQEPPGNGQAGAGQLLVQQLDPLPLVEEVQPLGPQHPLEVVLHQLRVCLAHGGYEVVQDECGVRVVLQRLLDAHVAHHILGADSKSFPNVDRGMPPEGWHKQALTGMLKHAPRAVRGCQSRNNVRQTRGWTERNLAISAMRRAFGGVQEPHL
mmetsp:Transcript_118006/g.366941  ORF Transcript_118006/g.366941 Transcript_118006/m.366941 type:complete len:300 (-) Transcript_118006:455-1354(-)